MKLTTKIFAVAIAVAILGVTILMTTTSDIKSDLNYLSFYDDHSYREGELLVMLKEGVDVNQFIKEFKDINLRVKQEVYIDYNIWLFEFDPLRSEAVDALLSVMGSRDVSIVQFNHEVELRQTIPNDPRFNEMWGLNNTGQTGGTPGADVKAPLAWDVTTGGITSTGDTVVVAVIDGGCMMTHPDLVDNVWRNWGEIPANGIDDDLNGYIDDVFGWNAFNNNGNVPSNSHGTHVAGTVGAMGDNNVGVTGVNWKVKIMNIAGSSGNEATVVTAYGYALKQRKIYNQTNGTQGAFVVSTNSSFGVDFGNPANFPIWCAFYDSLGVHGVLSAAATMNNGSNVDISGDVPTACPSDFMIAVTNTTNMDVRNSGAAFGPTTIDLGAPGTSILSTESNGAYSLKTGTSMATPHVAGAIGLMYAAASPLYMNLAKTQPDSAGRLFKHLLLSTVDTLASLQGQLVSGGRLNLNKFVNSVKITNVPVLHSFALQSPAPGSTITSFPLSNTQVTVTWDTSATGATYKWIFGTALPTRLLDIGSGVNSITLTLGQIDQILAGFGLQPGQSVSGQWDVWAHRQLPTVDSLKSSNGPRTITLARGIPPLQSFNLVAPPNNITIETSIFNSDPVQIGWSKSGDGTTYKWKFGAPNLSTNLLSITSDGNGYDSTLSTTNAALDGIIAGLGVNPGDSLNGQWAVYAYNGVDSLKSVQTYNITFKRSPVTALFYDDFSGGLGQWTISNDGGTCVWLTFSTPYPNTYTMPVTSNSPVFSADSDECGSGTTLNSTATIADNINCVGYTNIMLEWDNDFRHFSATTIARTQVSYDGGATWETIVEWVGVSKRNSFESYPLPNATNIPNLKVRFVSIQPGWHWWWTIDNVTVKGDIQTDVQNASSEIPESFALNQNYPNPFNPVTKINFAIPQQGMVTMKIFDITGREVATLVNEVKMPGYYSIDFNASVLSSGVYFYRLQSADFVDVKRMVLIK